MASLRLDRLTKHFDDGTEAVRSVSLTVPDGELLVIMGPSGCGKSTLLRLVAGLEAPSEGRVWLGGEDVTEVAPAERDVAMVFQSYALYPHMTVAENLGFGLKMRRVRKTDRATQVQDVAKLLGLSRLLDRRPKDLSGGEQQRVALGRALIRRPQLFLLDEPLSNLDASLRASLREEIRRLHGLTGTTMAYVTHDQHEALALAQRLAVMQAGRILQVAAPETLYRAPAALGVARALGHPPVNCVTGRPTSLEGKPCLETEVGTLPLPPHLRNVPLPPQVTLAIRPEDVNVGESGSGYGVTLATQVDRVEGAGPDRILWFRWGELRWAARLGEGTPAPDGPLPVRVRLDHMHLFDAETGQALRTGEGP